MTIRRQIIDAIADRLEAYSWTVFTAPDIHKGRMIFDPDQSIDPLPLVTIIPEMEEAEQSRYNNDLITMPVAVTCLMSLEDGADTYEICEPVFGELRQALFSGGPIEIGVDDTDEEAELFPFDYRGGGIVSYPTEIGPAVVNITVSAVVKYESTIGDPYTF